MFMCPTPKSSQRENEKKSLHFETPVMSTTTFTSENELVNLCIYLLSIDP